MTQLQPCRCKASLQNPLLLLPVQELARLQEGIKGEVEALREKLSTVRAEQAPWEAKLAEVNSRLSVAAAERDLLLKKQADAQKRLQVYCICNYTTW